MLGRNPGRRVFQDHGSAHVNFFRLANGCKVALGRAGTLLGFHTDHSLN